MVQKKVFRILIVDDDHDILELLSYNFEREGFVVKTISDSRAAVKVAVEFNPDLIVLDLMMPHPNGIEICRELRSLTRFVDTYIFFLTAKSERYYQEAALDTGGDDFIEKIMGLRALTFKVSSVLKKKIVIRKRAPELHFGDLKICRRTTSVRIGSREVVLSKPEFELLFFLAQNPHRTISADHLLRNMWGSETYMVETSVDAYISSLQNKIGYNLIEKRGFDSYRFS
ncbi:response regulator transcription factor [Pseudochryseolinea flava]|uniref:DNA-binding response regulator n=1 Tax=Pseudochryseolinea flava TaxID=2059302 RepID=A0A364XV64_9BACT|nr:response regulator transcription factor [Pseudochryseolinea flava]RAV98005.1 DNA-binding response regulator [Pseudochryseolinea flava]